MVSIPELIIGIILIIIGIVLLFRIKQVVSYPAHRTVGILAIVVGIAMLIISVY